MKPKEESSHFQQKEKLTLLERILRELNVDNLSLIRKAFYSCNNAVTMPEFVKIMRVQLHWDTNGNEEESVEGAMEEWGEYSSYYRDKNHEGLEKWITNHAANFGGKKNKEDVAKVMQLCEVFTAVDVDNSGDISWQEFTSYVIKNGVHVLKPIKPYRRIELAQPITGNNINRVVYLRPIDKLLVFDDSKYARVFKPEREKFTEEYTLVKELDCGAKVINAVYVGNQVINIRETDDDGDSDSSELEVEANYAPRQFGVGADQGVVTCGSDGRMLVWDCGVVWRLKGEIARPAASVNTYSSNSYSPSLFASKIGMEFSPLSMSYSTRDNTLFVGTQTGMIHAWTFSASSVPLRGSAVRAPTMWKTRERVLQQAHTDMVMDLTEIKNTRMIASSSLDADICLWDTHTMAVASRLKGHSKGVLATAYSSDFRILVSCGFDRDALVWNPMVNHSLYRLKGHYSSLIGVRAVENAPQFVTSDKTGTMKIWDIRTFECVQTLTLENCKGITNFDTVGSQRILVAAPKSVVCLEAEKPKNPTLTEESNLLYCGYNDQHGTIITAAGLDVKLWDGKTGLLQKSYDKISAHPISAVCVDDAQRKIFVGNMQGGIGIHHYDNGTLINILESHASEVSVLLYMPHKHAIMSISYDGKARLHDAHAASAVAQTYTDPAFQASSQAATRGELTARKVHDREGRARSVLKSARFQHEVCCATYSAVLGLVAVASKDGSIRVWDPDRWGAEAQLTVSQEIQDDSEEEMEIMCMTFLEPYPVLVCGDSTGVLTFFSVRPSLYKNHLLLQVDALSAVSSAGISFTKNKTISMFTVSTPLSSGGISKNSRVGGIYSVTFSEQHKVVFTGTESGDILGWSVENLFLKGDMKPHDPKKKNFNVTVETHAYTKPTIDPEDVEISHWWKAHSDVVTCLSVLGAGNGLLSGSKDKRVRAWDCNGNYHGTLRQVPTDEDWSLPVDTKSIHTNLIKTASNILHSIKLSPLAISIPASPEDSPVSSPSNPPPFGSLQFPNSPHTRRVYDPQAEELSPTSRRPPSPLRQSSPTSRGVPGSYFSNPPTSPTSMATPSTPTHPNLEAMHLNLLSSPIRPSTPIHPNLTNSYPQSSMRPSSPSRPRTPLAGSARPYSGAATARPSSPMRPKSPTTARPYSGAATARPSSPIRPRSPTSTRPKSASPATARPSTPTRPQSPATTRAYSPSLSMQSPTTSRPQSPSLAMQAPTARAALSTQSPTTSRPSTPQSPSLSMQDPTTSRPSTPTRPQSPSPATARPSTPQSPSLSMQSPVTARPMYSPTARPSTPTRPHSASPTTRPTTATSRSRSPLTARPHTPFAASPIPTTPHSSSPNHSPLQIPSLSHLNNRQQQAALRLSLALENLDN